MNDISLFEELLTTFDLIPDDGVVFAPTNDALNFVYAYYNTNHKEFKNFPYLRSILVNHIPRYFEPGIVVMGTGVRYSYNENVEVDHIPLLASKIKNLVQFKYLDGVILTKEQDQKIRQYLNGDKLQPPKFL